MGIAKFHAVLRKTRTGLPFPRRPAAALGFREPDKRGFAPTD